MNDLNDILVQARQEIAPTGRLRACINLGNSLLASLNSATGTPQGVSVDMARELSKRLEVPLDLQTVVTASDSVAMVAQDRADIGFFALDPARANQLRFASPYVLIEGAYLVRSDSPLQEIGDVDQEQHRVVVGGGTAYDLFLTRELRRATIIRCATSQAVIPEFLETGADAAAGVRQMLVGDLAANPGLRLLPGNFMEIRQAVGVPPDRSDRVVNAVVRFVEAMKAQGFVRRCLDAHGVQGARVADSLEAAI